MGLDTLELEVYTYNPRAYNVYIKCGFVEYKRENDTIFMQITKKSWLQI